MNEIDLARCCDILLRSQAMEGIKNLGEKQGSGYYIRVYILLWMMGHADTLVSVKDTADRSRCSKAQVQLLWDFLEERGALVEDDFGGYSLLDWMSNITKRIQSAEERDEFMADMKLTRDEVEDLKKRLGDDYMLCLHKAAEYKVALKKRHKTVNFTDYSIVLKSKEWIHGKSPKELKVVEEDDDDDDGIIVLPVPDDEDDQEEVMF